MTRILDTLRYSDDSLPNGELQISAPAFTSGAGDEIAASRKIVRIVDGMIDVSLKETDSALPAGIYYTVRFVLDRGSYVSYWAVPTSSDPVDLNAVTVAMVPPSPPLTALNVSQLSGGSAKGQIIVRTATGFTILGPGDNGDVLTVKSSDPKGVDWEPASGTVPPLGGDLSGTVPDATVDLVGGIAAADIASRLPTADVAAAEAGTDGTPSDINRFVTNSDPRNSDGRLPSGAAGGDLGGTYPDPTVDAVGGRTASEIGTNLPTDGEAAALAGTSGTPGAGNKYVTDGDGRLVDSRNPQGAAGGDLSGTYPNPSVAQVGGVAAAAVAADLPTAAQKAALAGTDGTPSGSNKYVTDSDARNTNARTPSAHAATHRGNGTDPIAAATDAIRGTVTMTTATSGVAVATDDPRLAANYRRELDTVHLVDDFLGGLTTSGSVGGQNWVVSGGVTAVAAGEAGHPGIINRSTGASSGTNAITELRTGGTTGLFLATDAWDMIWIVRLNTVDTDTAVRLGLTSDPSSGSPSNGAYLEKTAADTNWFLNTRSGGGGGRTDTGIAVGTEFIKVRLRLVSAGVIGATIDANAEVTRNANIPTAALMPFLHIVNSASAAKNIDIDLFDLIITGVGR